MSGLTRERGAAVIGLRACHPVLSSLLYREKKTSAFKKAVLQKRSVDCVAC